MHKGRQYPQTGNRWFDPESVNNWPPRKLAVNLDFEYLGFHYTGQTTVGSETLDLLAASLFWDTQLLGVGPNDFGCEVRLTIDTLDGSHPLFFLTLTEFSSGAQWRMTLGVPFRGNSFPWAIGTVNWSPLIDLARDPRYGPTIFASPVGQRYF